MIRSVVFCALSLYGVAGRGSDPGGCAGDRTSARETSTAGRWTYETMGSAQAAVLRECGAGCSVVLTFERCGAYAADQDADSTVVGWAESHSSSSAAQRAALGGVQLARRGLGLHRSGVVGDCWRVSALGVGLAAELARSRGAPRRTGAALEGPCDSPAPRSRWTAAQTSGGGVSDTSSEARRHCVTAGVRRARVAVGRTG